MRRMFLIVPTVLIAMSLNARIGHQAGPRINPGQDDIVITGQCAFPVLGHIDGIETITTFLDDGGNPIKQIVAFPGNRMTLTNLDAGTSVTVVSTGSSQLRLQPDGSTPARAMVTGRLSPTRSPASRGSGT